MSEIVISDVGPVESLRIPVKPGVVVLRGVNDSGKSESLEAVSRLAGGNAAVTCREKAASGSVEGLGVRLSVRQSARKTGELEALSIEGKLSIADLVSPGIKDQAAADRHRIKALLQLTGVKADIDLFGLPSEMVELISYEATKTDDLVEMAAKIKRDLEAASRKESDAAEKADSMALACKQAAEGVDLQVELDSAKLQANLENAIRSYGEIVSTTRAAEETKSRARIAAERLAKEASPPDVEAAQLDVYASVAESARLAEEAATLSDALTKARAAVDMACAATKAAEERLALAKSHAKAVEGWKETIAAGEAVECPTQEQIACTEASVTEARHAVEQAAVARAAKAKAEEAAKYFDAARTHRKAADRLRDAAKGTDDALSAAVASDSLTVKAGRLITQHPDRGEVFYAERSTGTRWKLAIDEAIKRIRQLGAQQTAIIPVPQEAWSELDPENKAAVHEYAVENGVTIITAEATTGELRAEEFGGAS